MRAAWREARSTLRARRRRAVLAAVGVGLAAMMLATSVLVSDGLGGGFNRSARAAQLPDVIARFDDQPASKVAARVGALPDLETFTTRLEITNIPLAANGHFSGSGVLEVLDPGRRGYAIVAGRDLGSAPGEVVVEQALARAWRIRVGSTLRIGRLRTERVVGLSEAPDNVGFPLAEPRVYVSRAGITASFPGRVDQDVNTVEVWLRSPAGLDATLEQARSESYGLRGLRLTTRSGVRLVLDQAAGIVIALLIALSAIALITAGVMLAASSRAEVDRRLRGIGVRRALGAGRGWVAGAAALESFAISAPAAGIGVLAGGLVATPPSTRLLELLNELPPGGRIVVPLIGCWALAVSVAVLTSAWPAWRAAGRSPSRLLRGADLAVNARRARPALRRLLSGLAGLGARLVAARRARLASTLVVLGVSAAFILLMLALASELVSLQSDPGTLGRRYALSASLPATQGRSVAGLPGVAAAAPRYEVTALDSFSLGETIDVIAYPGDHTTFEAPPLVAGRRLRGADEAEVGSGLANVLGLDIGSTLALELPGGSERRLRVAGIVSSLDHDGRIAYIPAAALLAADPGAPEQIAIVLAPGASSGPVIAGVDALGGHVDDTPGALDGERALISALTAILRAIAVVDGLVCLYALVQALALTAQERRTTLGVLRACGAGTGSVARLLAGAAVCVLTPAAIVGVILERTILGPVMSRIAADYAVLPLAAGPGEIALLVGGLALIGAVAVAVVARQAVAGARVVSGTI
ncbi:MAG TPA: FtsX-like permease family protein [Solirubrobacteraceae bacterium]